VGITYAEQLPDRSKLDRAAAPRRQSDPGPPERRQLRLTPRQRKPAAQVLNGN
jgi:hypothetical protein